MRPGGLHLEVSTTMQTIRLKDKLEKRCVASLWLHKRSGQLKLLANSLSGHGFGSRGDRATAGFISMRQWARKAQLIARELGITAKSARDNLPHCCSDLEDSVGISSASHNEKKLITYALYWVYARAEGVTFREGLKRNLTRKDMLKLQGFALRDGSRPRFLITLRPPTPAQKVCGTCERFVSAVAKIASINLRLEVVELRETALVVATRVDDWTAAAPGRSENPQRNRNRDVSEPAETFKPAVPTFGNRLDPYKYKETKKIAPEPRRQDQHSPRVPAPLIGSRPDPEGIYRIPLDLQRQYHMPEWNEHAVRNLAADCRKAATDTSLRLDGARKLARNCSDAFASGSLTGEQVLKMLAESRALLADPAMTLEAARTHLSTYADALGGLRLACGQRV